MTQPLSNVQVEILQTFNYDLNEAELASFKKMLVDYFAERISDDIDAFFATEGWGEEQNEEWEKTHMRTPYKEKV